MVTSQRRTPTPVEEVLDRYLGVEQIAGRWPVGLPGASADLQLAEFQFRGFVRADLLPGGLSADEEPAAFRARLLSRSEDLMSELAGLGWYPSPGTLDQEFRTRFGTATVTVANVLFARPPQREVELWVRCDGLRWFRHSDDHGQELSQGG